VVDFGDIVSYNMLILHAGAKTGSE